MTLITDEKEDHPLEKDHPSHHHTLHLQCSKTNYECNGCREQGSWNRYRCEDCDYDLHKVCALASPHISHPYEKGFFEFLEQSKTERYCDACGEDVNGFVYHCYETGRDMHPCCALLPAKLEGDGMKLILKKKLSSKCDACGVKEVQGKVKGWSYRSTCGEYEFHVSCVKAMIIKQDRESEKLGDQGEMNNKSVSSLEGKVPDLQLKVQKGVKKGKFGKYRKMLQVVLTLIVSAIIGEPTTLIALAIHSLIS